MSYAFASGAVYRMPTHFGPAPGPRQHPEGGRFDNTEEPRTLTAWMSWTVPSDEIADHLPPGFHPTHPGRITIEIRARRNLPWLAGRGYNILMVSFDVLPPNDLPRGRLQAAVWESLPDAVMTGREELGVPKLWAEVADLPHPAARETIEVHADWLGFRFFETRFTDLREDEASARHDITGPPYYQWRYFPRPGHWGEADVSYATMTPGAVPARRVVRSWSGQAAVHLHRPTWADMPTQSHIVTALAALAPDDCVAAGLNETVGSRDLSDQQILPQAAEPLDNHELFPEARETT